jgi:hypothetical protein
MGLYDYFPQTQALQQPDILGNYLRGLSAPGVLQAQQQENTLRGLNIDQTRMILQNQGILQNYARQQLTGEGGNSDTGAGAPSVGRSGGVQNGPQDAVAGTSAAPPMLSYGIPSAPPAPASTYAGASAGSFMSGGTQRALAILSGKYDPVNTERGIFENQKQQAQLQAQGPIALADTVRTSPNAATIIRSNPSLQSIWFKNAPALNIDPYAGLSPSNPNADANARAVATFSRNQLAGSVGLATVEMPDPLQNLYGPNGQLLQRDPITNKETEVVGQKLPTYAMQDLGYDTQTGQDRRQLMVTSPGGSPAPGAPGGSGGGAGGGGLGTFVGPQIAAYKPPTAENIKSAGFASALRGALGTMRDMEGQGYALSPSDRAQLINVASDEDPGLLHQWVSQELLSHKLDQQGQTYLTATMAAVQALSHDQSGARLNGSTIRSNLESAIPIDVKNRQAMQQIEQFRNGYYKDTLMGAGPVAMTPAFNDTLGSDLRTMQSGGQLPGDVAKVSSDADYASLRPGSRFVGPDGKIRKKPAQSWAGKTHPKTLRLRSKAISPRG